MTGRLAANLGMVANLVVWGTPLPLLEILLRRWDPIFLAASRYFFALPLLLLLLWIFEPRRFRSGFLPDGVSPARLGLLGLGMCGYVILFMIGLDHSHPVTAAVLAAASPVIAAGVAWICYRERPAPGLAPTLVLAVAGGALASVDFGSATSTVSLRGGEILILASIASWSWYSIAVQRAMPGCSQLHLTTVTVLAAALLLAVFYPAAIAAGLAEPPPGRPGTEDMAMILWLSVSMIVIGVLTWNLGVKTLGLVVASMYLNFIPVVAVVTSIGLGIEPRPEQIAGGLLVVAGLLYAQLRQIAAGRRARRA